MGETEDEKRIDQLTMMLNGAVEIAERRGEFGEAWCKVAKGLVEDAWDRLHPNKPNPPIREINDRFDEARRV